MRELKATPRSAIADSRTLSWRYGRRVAMMAVFLAVACKNDAAAPVPPASIEPSTAVTFSDTVNTVLTPSPTFVVRDASGRALSGVPVTIAVTAGGGTLTNASTRTSGGGTRIGNWKLGTQAGRNAITITVQGLPPLVIEALGVPDRPAALLPAVGNLQEAAPGAPLPSPVGVKVVDQFGNGIPGISVTFGIAKGNGSVNPITSGTNAEGIALTNWTLGKSAGSHELSASTLPTGTVPAFNVRLFATGASNFHIALRFYGTPPSADIANVFTTSVDRIRGAVVGDISDFVLTGFDAARCGVQPAEILNETVDDVIIYATVTPIDGVGKILGSAGPCVVRSTSRFAIIGIMRFDVDDLANLASSGRLEAVILHEMLHVIGVGTIWRSLNLILDSGQPDPRYIGPIAISRCQALGGVSTCASSVPIENVGGSGSIESHWRESVFDNELMTSVAEGTGVPMPLSAITIGSLEDYGYGVNYLSADPYALTALVAPWLRAPTVREQWEQIVLPVYEGTSGGPIRPVR